ncbi:MAG: oligosaccharide flippase family protein [Duncaniella sp.]|nr:oligosaccharide flippase family protein [Duncaniella sp.]
MARIVSQRPSLTRKVLAAMGTFGGLQMVQILCGAIRVKLVALWLGAAGVGLFTIFNNAVTMVAALSQLGLRQTAVRDVAAARSSGSMQRAADIARLIRRLSLWLGLAGLLVMVLAAPFLSRETFGHFSYTLQFAALGVMVLMLTLTAGRQALLQGLGHLGPLARCSLIGVGGGLLVSIPMFYFWRLDSIVPSLIAYTFFGLAATVYVYRRDTRSLPAPRPLAAAERRGMVTDLLRLGLFMTGADITSQLLNYIFVAWLNTIASTAEVGVYQSGYTIVSRYVGMVFTAIGVEYYPRLASQAARPDRMGLFVAHEMRLLMFILCPVLIVFIPLAPLFVEILYSKDFAPAVPYILAALPGMVLRGVSWCMAFVMLAKGDGLVYMLTEIASALVGLLLNIAGYTLLGLRGLGLAFTLWYLVYTVIVAFVYYRRYRMTLPPRIILLALATLLLVTAATLLIPLI